MSAGSNRRRGLHVSVAFCALSALAPPARADWRAAGFLGAGHTSPSALQLRQPALTTAVSLDPVEFKGNSFEFPLYYGYRFGRDLPFASGLAIEGEFIHLKVYAETTLEVTARGTLHGVPVDRRLALEEVVSRFSLSHGLNFVLVNVVYRHSLGDERSRWTLTARAGLGPTLPHAESTINGRSRDDYQLGSLAGQVAGGIEVRMLRHLSGIAEYKLTRTREKVEVPDGEISTLMKSHHVVVGLGVQF